MRRINLAGALVALSMLLGGCAGTPLGDAWQKFTTTIANPVDATDINRAKNAYAAALELAAEYRRYCWSAPYKVLMADPSGRLLCERRRAVVRAIRAAGQNASAALVAAENFVANYPTLNAAGAVGAAWQAVRDFQAAIPAK